MGENAENPTRLLGKMSRIDVESQSSGYKVAPTVDDLGIASARIIARGTSGRSVLLARMARRGAA